MVLQDWSPLPLPSALNMLVRLRVSSSDQLMDFTAQQALHSVRAHAVAPAVQEVGGRANASPASGGPQGVLKALARAILVPRALPVVGFVAAEILCGIDEHAETAPTSRRASAAVMAGLADFVDGVRKGADRQLMLGCAVLLRCTLGAAASSSTRGQHDQQDGPPETPLQAFVDRGHAALVGRICAALGGLASSVAAAVDGASVQPPRLVVEANNAAIDVASCVIEHFAGASAARIQRLPDPKEAAGKEQPLADAARRLGLPALQEALWGTLSTWRAAFDRSAKMLKAATAAAAAGGTGGLAASSSAVEATALAAATGLLHRLAREKDAGDLRDYNAGLHKSGLGSVHPSLRLAAAVAAWGPAMTFDSGSGLDTSATSGKALVERMCGAWAQTLRTPDADGPTVGATEQAVIVLCGDALRLFAFGPAATGALWHSHPELSQACSELLTRRGLQYGRRQAESKPSGGGGEDACEAEVVRLSAALLRTMLPVNNAGASSSTAGGAASVAFAPLGSVDSMIDLLDSSDAAAECTLQLVADAAVQRPHLLLPRIASMLEAGPSSKPAARANALTVIDAVVSRCGAATGDGEGRIREALDRLGRELMLRLTTDDMAIRARAASVFAKLPPVDVVGDLVRRATTRDDSGRARGACIDALCGMLRHTDVSMVPDLIIELTAAASAGEGASGRSEERRRKLVDAAGDDVAAAEQRRVLAKAVTPADLAQVVSQPSEQQSAADGGKTRTQSAEDVAATVAKRWVQDTSVAWPAVLPQLVKSVLQSGTARQEGEPSPSGTDRASPLLDFIVRYAVPAHAVAARARLCEMLAPAVATAIGLAVSPMPPPSMSDDEALLAVAPLVVLRCAPMGFLDGGDDAAASSGLVAVLVSGCENLLAKPSPTGPPKDAAAEVQSQAARLVIECFARCPTVAVMGVLDATLSRKAALEEAALRKTLFVLCSALQQHAAAADRLHPSAGDPVPAVAQCLAKAFALADFAGLVADPSSNPMLLRAVADSVATAQWWQWATAPEANATVLESVQSLLADVDAAEGASASSRLMVPVTSSVVTMLRSATEQRNVTATVPRAVRRGASALIPRHINAANAAVRTGDHGLGAAHANSVFGLVVSGAPLAVPSEAAGVADPDATVSAVTDFAVGCARFEKAEAVRHAGIKLIGAVLMGGGSSSSSTSGDTGGDTSYLRSVSEEQLTRVTLALERAALIGSDPAVRALAERLHSALSSAATAHLA